MIDFLNTYSAELAQGFALLAIAAPFIRQRIVSDKNILNVFNSAKESIKQTNEIRSDMFKSLMLMGETIQRIDGLVDTQSTTFQEVILAFQEDELYTKMLEGLSQLDELHQILQDKDSTIEMLSTELREMHKTMQEFQQMMKE